MSGLRLKVGKFYRMRNGEQCGPIEPWNPVIVIAPMTPMGLTIEGAPPHHTFMMNGESTWEPQFDLVSKLKNNKVRIKDKRSLRDQFGDDPLRSRFILAWWRDQWQPITTAPKEDGTYVDLWIEHTPERAKFDGRIVDCFWSEGAWRRKIDFRGEVLTVEQLEPGSDGGAWRATFWRMSPGPPPRRTLGIMPGEPS